jgi:hypothetical protein
MTDTCLPIGRLNWGCGHNAEMEGWGYVSNRTGWGITFVCSSKATATSLYSPVELSGEWDGKGLAVGAFEGPCSNRHEHDRALAHDVAPHRSSPSHAQTLHDRVSPYPPGHIHPYNQPPKKGNKKKKKLQEKGAIKREGNVAYQISRRHCGSSLDLSHILRTRRPSNLASDPGSGRGMDAEEE